MIVFRYLSKEIVTVLVAVTAILLLIFLSNQFVRYLGYAADGRLLSSILFELMLLEVPQLLGLLLPLGLFLGILLAYGRLYVDGEMTVLAACGLSRTNLVAYTMVVTAGVTLLVAMLTLFISPYVLSSKGKIIAQSSASLLTAILPGKFQATPDGSKVFYVESMSRDRQNVQNVFVAERPKSSKETDENWTVLSAKSGYQFLDKNTHDEFVVATQGYRYQGIPGQLDYRIIKFGKYGVRIDDGPIAPNQEKKALPTAKIWRLAKNHDVHAIAELQWRLSVPLSAILLALLAVPMSRVKPRHGKYAQLLPSVLIYIIYVNMLFVGRTWVATGAISPGIGMWWIHGILLFLVLLLLPMPATWRSLIRVFFKSREVAV